MADTGTDDGLDEIMRRIVLNAAVKELATSSVGSFSLEGVAARAGVDLRLIKQTWSNTPELFTAMLGDFAARHLPVPDTGSFRGDLLDYAHSYAATVNTPTGRRMLDALIVKPEDWELSGSRAAFLEFRVRRIGVMVQRAVARGECPADTDPALTIDMLAVSLCLPVLFYDQPVTEEHCRYVVDTLLNGIAGSADRPRSEMPLQAEGMKRAESPFSGRGSGSSVMHVVRSASGHSAGA